MTVRALPAVLVLLLTGCSSLAGDLPEESPPLVGMREPARFHEEPDDEAERQTLPLGSFTGIRVTDARSSLSDLGSVPEGVLVQSVVENSPGDAAGVREGDLILGYLVGGDAEVPLSWPSEWDRLERDTEPGSEFTLLVDRAGVGRKLPIKTVARVRAGKRRDAERFREEDRIGIVLRTATEVEAHKARLGAGGGAVVVGLSAGSPWRAAGMQFGDLIVKIDGRSVAHPQVVLDAIRDAEEDSTIRVKILRRSRVVWIEAPLSRRVQELRTVSVPPLFSYESARGESETSVLLGLVRQRTTRAAWEWRFLWLFDVSGGDADRLEETE